jgi:hypothetical protein
MPRHYRPGQQRAARATYTPSPGERPARKQRAWVGREMQRVMEI